ncbi:formyltetrahydrofolate deformylase [Pseudoteredinibacter isoporae]|uniref:formyltetrahydrofolate deformylase n=1 Tax=Pseudoteredinibacter isoporae TaxID=570281 RepID=UPI003104663D
MTQQSNHVSEIVLTLSCNDKPGIVAAVANLFALQGFNIRESSQFEDVHSKRFFMRTVFEASEGAKPLGDIKSAFKAVAERYDMQWSLCDVHRRARIVIAVSKWGHCLNNLLNSWKRGSLPVDIVAVVSNHEDMRELVEWYDVPYHYMPVSAENKAEQEAHILDLIDEQSVDLLVLARYMQILSPNMTDALQGRAINIHHSFLPGFKGAKPYHQAYARGVKLIGATAHFVTEDLDEGPIIEQDVERVSHINEPEELVEIGRDIESRVLGRAVRWFAQQRILANGNKTVVFSR